MEQCSQLRSARPSLLPPGEGEGSTLPVSPFFGVFHINSHAQLRALALKIHSLMENST